MSVLQSLAQSTPLEEVVQALLPINSDLHLDRLVVAPDQVVIGLLSAQSQATCSVCSQPTARVQSRYKRTLADLPWANMRVVLRLQVRRFICSNSSCPRKIFTERLPDLVVPYARRTNRLGEQVLNIANALGGEAGARQCAKQGIAISPDTLLTLLRHQTRTADPTPRILGVDDWSFRRGKPMGTILVDLERHVPIDLLPDSSEEAFAAWLRAHPGIEIISRDRGGAYASGARAGAPEAIQVADRWHLLKNLGDAVHKLMGRQGAALKQAAQAASRCANQGVPEVSSQPVPVSKRGRRQPKPPKESFQRSWQLSMHQRVQELFAQGNTVAAIARELNLHRGTVRKYRDMEQFEDLRLSVRRSAVEPYRAYLEQRWAEGCTEVKQLWQEEKARAIKGVTRACGSLHTSGNYQCRLVLQRHYHNQQHQHGRRVRRCGC
jgi:transposase